MSESEVIDRPVTLAEVKQMIREAVERAAASEDLEEVHAAIEELAEDAKVFEPEQPELPLWDGKVHVDADKGVAWRDIRPRAMSHTFRVRTSLVDADLLTDGRHGRGRHSSKLRLDFRAYKDELRLVTVSKGREALGRRVLLRSVGPPPTSAHSVDHIDRDPSNNERLNLQWATKKEQALNRSVSGTSQFLYVSKATLRPAGKDYFYWIVTVRISTGGQKHGGLFPFTAQGEIDAARAADALSIKLNGPDAKTNVRLGLLPPLEEQTDLFKDTENVT